MRFDFVQEERRVGMYYFYMLDPEFGPGFIKICTYFPYPAKVWLNGHEWAKRQADQEGLAYTALANGFASCADPAAPPGDLRPLRSRPTSRASSTAGPTVIPTPFTEADRAAGYFWDLSMRQVEVSRTLVFDDPRRARGFFEALVADNIDIGRPEEVSAVFARQVEARPPKSPSRTRIFSPGTEVKMDFSLQAQPGQAVPERREGPAHRDRHQQARGPRHPLPDRAPARAGGAGPGRSTTVCL